MAVMRHPDSGEAISRYAKPPTPAEFAAAKKAAELAALKAKG